MSALILPNRFLVQPQYPAQIAKNPLTLGLVSLFTPASGNATPIGGITPIIGADGVGFRATSQAAYYRASSTRIISGSTQWTVVVGFSTTQGLSSSGASLYCERGPSGGNILKVEGLGNSIPYLQMTVRDDAFSLTQFQGSTTVTNDGKFHIAAGVQYATNDRRLFIDGRLEASNSGTVSAAYTEAGVESRIGSDSNDGSSLFAGPIYFVALYNRALDPTEIAAIWERRWDAFFKASARRLWAVSSSSTNYTLTADPFSLTFTGTDANLEYNSVLSADSASLSFDVADATLKRGYSLTADPVSLDFSGADAALKYNRVLQADAAAIQLTGADVSLEYSRALQADPATIQFDVADATLTYTQPGNYVLTAEPVTLGFAVADASLKYDRKLSADPAELAFNGPDASLRYARVVIAEATQIAFTAADATLSRTGGPEPITSIVERTAIFRRSKSVTVRFN